MMRIIILLFPDFMENTVEQAEAVMEAVISHALDALSQASEEAEDFETVASLLNVVPLENWPSTTERIIRRKNLPLKSAA